MSLMMLAKEVETTTEEVIMTAGEVASNIDKKANAFIDYFQSHVNTMINFGIKVIIAILLFIAGRFLIKFILKVCDRCFTRAGTEVSVKKFLHSLIKVVLNIILIIIVCSQLGIETTSFIAVMGSAGLALGLSLQGSLSNFAGGILILILKPFVVGDYIIDGGSSKEGKVQRIDLFYTHLVTVDNKMIVIPNGELANSNITNLTTFDKRRIDLYIGIGYASDINKAKQILEKIANSHELVLKDSEIFVFVSSLDESQVTMGMRVWTNTDDYWTVKYQLNEQIKTEFDLNNIEIPFNQIDVHLKK